jgi:hypothetical protein
MKHYSVYIVPLRNVPTEKTERSTLEARLVFQRMAREQGKRVTLKNVRFHNWYNGAAYFTIDYTGQTLDEDWDQ